MLFSLSPGQAYKLKLTVRPFVKAGIRSKQSITVLLNGNPITEVTLHEPSWQDCEIRLPAKYVNHINQLTLRYRYHEMLPEAYFSGILSSLAIAIKNISFEKIQNDYQ
jgi:hypothetical protein